MAITIVNFSVTLLGVLLSLGAFLIILRLSSLCSGNLAKSLLSLSAVLALFSVHQIVALIPNGITLWTINAMHLTHFIISLLFLLMSIYLVKTINSASKGAKHSGK